MKLTNEQLVKYNDITVKSLTDIKDVLIAKINNTVGDDRVEVNIIQTAISKIIDAIDVQLDIVKQIPDYVTYRNGVNEFKDDTIIWFGKFKGKTLKEIGTQGVVEFGIILNTIPAIMQQYINDSNIKKHAEDKDSKTTH